MPTDLYYIKCKNSRITKEMEELCKIAKITTDVFRLNVLRLMCIDSYLNKRIKRRYKI